MAIIKMLKEINICLFSEGDRTFPSWRNWFQWGIFLIERLATNLWSSFFTSPEATASRLFFAGQASLFLINAKAALIFDRQVDIWVVYLIVFI